MALYKTELSNNLTLSTGKWAASGECESAFLKVFKQRWALSEKVGQVTLKASQAR